MFDPSPLLVRLVRLVRRDTLTEAARRANQAVPESARPVGHNDILTQLPFGTWRFLLPDRDPGRQLLWSKALGSAFAGLTAPRSTWSAPLTGSIA
ncbi:MAG: hypothetical protein LBG60_09010 [Bifidobacteriaceae bacterium]|nr:hypothetical protein [Bifidobacteriaceae bacterium]